MCDVRRSGRGSCAAYTGRAAPIPNTTGSNLKCLQMGARARVSEREKRAHWNPPKQRARAFGVARQSSAHRCTDRSAAAKSAARRNDREIMMTRESHSCSSSLPPESDPLGSLVGSPVLSWRTRGARDCASSRRRTSPRRRGRSATRMAGRWWWCIQSLATLPRSPAIGSSCTDRCCCGKL